MRFFFFIAISALFSTVVFAENEGLKIEDAGGKTMDAFPSSAAKPSAGDDMSLQGIPPDVAEQLKKQLEVLQKNQGETEKALKELEKEIQ